MTKTLSETLTADFLASAAPAVRDHLATSTTLSEYLQDAGTLTLDERKVLVDQALVLLEQNYVHLPPKVALHAVNPVQRLRLLQIKLDRQTDQTMDRELDFHAELSAIFHSLGDLHTNYLLPAPFAGQVAYLPFLVEEYAGPDGVHRYVVSHLAQGFSAAGFQRGVEVTHWSGVPIDLAVERNAARFAGSNPAARHSRGLQSLTVRPLVIQLPPDEHWVTVTYLDVTGARQELRVEWLVVRNLPLFNDRAEVLSPATAAQGLDLDGHATGRAKTLLFAPDVLADRQPTDSNLSRMPTVFKARTVSTPSGSFGHIRIFTFNVDDPDAFVQEFVRLIGLLPQNGLIIDVRDNGGGHLWASEFTLQTLTPRPITPEPTAFINLPLNLRICRKHKDNPTNQIDLGPWFGSLEQDRELGAQYSQGFPITPADQANALGQRYYGPVVLITNARCYSATDFFAAGFADHKIGTILGVDPTTGAGGANVWTHGLLKALMDFEPADPASPYQDLPKGADMRVAIRRSLRVGPKAGVPVEDLGVQPDVLHAMTRADVLEDNPDLMAHAGQLLAGMPLRSLEAEAVSVKSGVRVELRTTNIDRAAVWLDGQPRAAVDVTDGTGSVVIDEVSADDKANPATRLRVDGYADGELVASRAITSRNGRGATPRAASSRRA
jgi:Peptidase family S41